jgi:hypothetical protein
MVLEPFYMPVTTIPHLHFVFEREILRNIFIGKIISI